MCDFVDDSLLDFLRDLIVCLADGLDVALKEQDAIGHRHPVVTSPFRQRDSCLESHEQVFRSDIELVQHLGRWFVINGDIDVAEPLPELLRQHLERVSNQLFESVPIQLRKAA